MQLPEKPKRKRKRKRKRTPAPDEPQLPSAKRQRAPPVRLLAVDSATYNMLIASKQSPAAVSTAAAPRAPAGRVERSEQDLSLRSASRKLPKQQPQPTSILLDKDPALAEGPQSFTGTALLQSAGDRSAQRVPEMAQKQQSGPQKKRRKKRKAVGDVEQPTPAVVAVPAVEEETMEGLTHEQVDLHLVFIPSSED